MVRADFQTKQNREHKWRWSRRRGGRGWKKQAGQGQVGKENRRQELGGKNRQFISIIISSHLSTAAKKLSKPVSTSPSHLLPNPPLYFPPTPKFKPYPP